MSQISSLKSVSPTITRLVKMTFRKEEVETFQKIFSENKKFIAAFEGCLHLELQRDVNAPNIFFTISKWRSAGPLRSSTTRPCRRWAVITAGGCSFSVWAPGWVRRWWSKMSWSRWNWPTCPTRKARLMRITSAWRAWSGRAKRNGVAR